MAIPSGYTEVDVPPHIISIFNQAFDEEIEGCRLAINASGHVNDAEIWKALVAARNNNITFDDTDDEAEEDEVVLKSNRKIRWH